MNRVGGALLVISFVVVVVVVSIFGSMYTYGAVSGFATNIDNATINITIETAALINFTTDLIEFGSGVVLGDSATLLSAPADVSGGNWSFSDQSFQLENIGNTNVSIVLKSGKNASAFIGGTSPVYQFNVTDAETSSCLNTTSAAYHNLSLLRDATTSEVTICEIFPFRTSTDTINITIRLVIPVDSNTGVLTDQLQATATAN